MSQHEMPKPDRWWELLDAVTDETATESQWRDVDELLRASEDFRRLYVAHMQTVGQLRWSGRNHTAHDGHESQTDTQPRALKSWTRGVFRFFAKPTPLSMTVAALVIGLLITAMAFMMPPFYRAITGVNRENPEPGSYQIVAEVTGLYDPVWVDESNSAHDGAFLIVGRELRLKGGVIEITYRTGARILLEGPVALTISNNNMATLVLGKLVAHVPQAAQGFTVETEHARIVDRGTEFAIDADLSGDAEVHVIDGLVEVHTESDGESQVKQLSAGQAVKVVKVASAAQLQDVDYRPHRFARVSPVSEDEWEAASPLPVTRDLSLWLAADYGIVRDAEGKVIVWKDRLTGDNRRADNAVQRDSQRRPLWMVEGLHGKPAIQFDGRSTNLMTGPRQITRDHTLIAVFTPDSSGNGGGGGQIFNSGAIPNYVLDVVSGRVVVRSWDGEKNIPNLSSDEITLDAPAIAEFVHSQSTNECRLVVNGKANHSRAAEHEIRTAGRAFIGSHIYFDSFFHGDLAELIIFDTALSEDEVRHVREYLALKYDIQP